MSHIPAERCLSIIELLADGAGSMALGAISERLDLPKSGAHRLLATLVEQGWVEQDPETGFYRLTMRLAVLGQQFYVATGIPDICQPLLDRLARQSREFARLAVVDGDSLVWVAHAQGATGGLVYHPSLTSNTVPLYATASGKAWLATLKSDDAVQKIVRGGSFTDADRYGPNVIRSIETLLRDVKRTAQRGYGIASSEAEPGVTAIAAAICSAADGAALGTVSVAGPSVRMTDSRIQELAPLVRRYASELASLWPLRARPGAVPAPEPPRSRAAARLASSASSR
jgi:IclR family transcriptional regulator, acetate operon repressor